MSCCDNKYLSVSDSDRRVPAELGQESQASSCHWPCHPGTEGLSGCPGSLDLWGSGPPPHNGGGVGGGSWETNMQAVSRGRKQKISAEQPSIYLLNVSIQAGDASGA